MRENSERLMLLLRGGTVDRPPYWEPWFCMVELLKLRWGGDYVKMADELGHSAVPAGGVGAGFTFAKHTTKDPVTGVYYGGGELRTREQLKACPMPDYEPPLNRARAVRHRCTDAGIACWMVLPWCFHTVATQMGLEHFALACYDDLDFVRDALAEVERRNAQAIRQVIAQVKPDFVLYDGDCAYGNGTMVSPSLLRELTYDITLPNVRAIQQLGIPVTFHSDGKLDGVIPLPQDLGIAAVHGCEKQANSLEHLVETFGDRIVLCGNMDVVFLHAATPQEVQEQTLTMLRTGGRKGRFISGCNTSPQDYIPEANYRAMLQTVRDWRPDAVAA